MDTKDTKSVLELKRSIVVIQQNINKLYNICSALYQEIQDVKHFVDFKTEDGLGDVENTTSNINRTTNRNTQTQHNLDVLKSVEEFADASLQGQRGRKLKIIDN